MENRDRRQPRRPPLILGTRNPQAASTRRRRKGDGTKLDADRVRRVAPAHRRTRPVAKPIRGLALELKRPRLARVVAKCPAITGNYRRFSPPGPDQAHLRPNWTIPANPPKSAKSSSRRLRGRWRDPDSNRGHHDFQSRGRNPLIGSFRRGAREFGVAAWIQAIWAGLALATCGA
jgi:hypothetical protein